MRYIKKLMLVLAAAIAVAVAIPVVEATIPAATPIVQVATAGVVGTDDAQAVPSYDYCVYSLRGGGTLAPDNDVKANWDWLEANYGWNITSSYPSTTVVTSTVRLVLWSYWRSNGSLHQSWFFCSGSGSSYGDAVYVR